MSKKSRVCRNIVNRKYRLENGLILYIRKLEPVGLDFEVKEITKEFDMSKMEADEVKYFINENFDNNLYHKQSLNILMSLTDHPKYKYFSDQKYLLYKAKITRDLEIDKI